MAGYFSSKQTLALGRSLISKASPAYVQFYLTARCNLACEQCNIIYADAASPEMSISQIRKMAENMAEIGVAIVLLIGGEPFVRKDLPQIIEAFVSNGIHVRMQTNGLASRDQLEASISAGAHDISVSLDSLAPSVQDKINGDYPKSWNRAIKTVAMINELFPENGTAFFNSVLMPRNIFDIPGVLEFATAIGWGVSVVPVHVTKSSEPRGYRTIMDTNPVTFSDGQFKDVGKVIERLKLMKRQGLNLYDSNEYLDDIPRFVGGKETAWRDRNGGICDSPNLYFAISPDGRLKPCCDFELENSFLVYENSFPRDFRSGTVAQSVSPYTQGCDGCMYGSYPEITISARYISSMLERFLYFSRKRPKLIRMTVQELSELASEIYERESDFRNENSIIARGS